MATAMKNKNTKVVKEDVKVQDETITISETTEVEEKQLEKKKVYAENEGIPCKSITPGKLFMEGIKSKIVYRWTDNGDVVEVEYQDLIAAIRSNSTYVMKPFFVIEDNELVNRFPQLKRLYESMYSIKDLKDVLTTMSVEEMEKTILALPEGAKDSIKHLASKMISNGTLDSVQKIKCLDKIYDTEMMMMTGLFGE